MSIVKSMDKNCCDVIFHSPIEPALLLFLIALLGSLACVRADIRVWKHLPEYVRSWRKASIFALITLGCAASLGLSGNGIVNDLKAASPPDPDSTIVDRKGNIYTTKVMLDGERWLTTNLNIPVEGSYCYGDTQAHCRKYGRLYTWDAARKACDMLGGGWRLPTFDEWNNMISHYGGVRTDSGSDGKRAFKALIAGGNSGFNVVLGGNRNPDSTYGRLNAHGFYWTATETAEGVVYMNFAKGSGAVFRQDGGERSQAFSVRCIRP